MHRHHQLSGALMSAISAILVNSLSAVALLGLLVAVIDDRKRQQLFFN
jgi:hypothetical protein